ncbi:LRR repeats protein [Cryptosporidium ryanae]|uniref:LRR repeats protein n=1 Tax=Cryptosporidium ryanae TaxID=515981 RepID=UPI00351A2E2A|nr:LRR repeats protein [Cryptosporidium ryanae]
MINIGDRVLSIDNGVGTVRSISISENSEQLFVIQWDSELNNDSTQEFICEGTNKFKHYNKGSFNTGVSFQHAIINRYLSEEYNSEFFVGLKMAYEYCRRLSSLSLENMNISCCSCDKLKENYDKSIIQKLSTCFKNVESVYLNNNLISDWKTVYCILSHLTNTRYLILNGNKMSKNSEKNKLTFDKIKILSLSKTNIEFEKVAAMCNEDSVFPNVEHINISSNNYSYLEFNGKNNVINVIDLSYNMILDWEIFRIKILENFVKLSTINISNNNFINIPEINSESNINYVYPNVNELIMDECGLETLNSILYLSRTFPNLKQISLRNNKLFGAKSCEYDMRSIIISLFPNIKTYNRSIIKQEDIVSSQRYYISQYLVHMNADLRKIDPNSDILLNFMSNNVSNDIKNLNIEEKSQEAKYIELKFIPKFKKSELMPTIKINKKITISEIKMIISRLYKIPKNEPLKLTFENENTNIDISEYNNTLTLNDIGISNSGNIFILDSSLN